MSHAELEKEIILIAYGDRIEIWDRVCYYQMIEDDADDFADLANEVMGDINIED